MDVFGGIAFKISVDFYVLLPIQSVAAFFIINYVTLILTFVINRIFSLVKTFANSSQESQQSLMMLMPTGRYNYGTMFAFGSSFPGLSVSSTHLLFGLLQVIMQRLNKDNNALRGTHHPGSNPPYILNLIFYLFLFQESNYV